jgi:hypothetical protein
MANTFNTGVYPQEWATKLQERLDHPTNWKEIADVIYSDTQVFNIPYMSTEPVVQVGTRGTAYSFTDFALTNGTLTITTQRIVPVFIDRGDMAQCKLVNQMELADLQGQQLNEKVEIAMLALHASYTDFGDLGAGALGLGSGQITVSATNIDDIVRGIRREIVTANGADLAARNGIFFVWRPADFEFLEQFAQANGFNLADAALKNGLSAGYHLMGADHYISNDYTANHLFAGVKKCLKIGILKSTYGQIVVTQDPNLQSGVGIISRLDYGTMVPTKYLPVLYDVNVA